MTIKIFAIGLVYFLKVEHISYAMGTHALPDICTLTLGPAAFGQVRINQAKYSYPWYNYYMYHFHISDQRIVSAYNHIILYSNGNEIYALRVIKQ